MLAALNKYVVIALVAVVVALGGWGYVTNFRLKAAAATAEQAAQRVAVVESAFAAYKAQATEQAAKVVAASKVRSATSAKAATILTRSDSKRTAETVAADARDVSQLWEGQDEVAAD